MTANNIAVAYLRASTDEQKLGPEAQRKAIEEYAERNSLTIISWHTDLGVSGSAKIEDRQHLTEAFASVQANHAAKLLVAKRDRIARDVLIALMVERELASYGAKLVSADGIGAGDTPEAELLRGMIDLIAQYERGLIRMRTKAAMAVKKARREPVGRPPFGFAYVGGCLEQRPDEQVAVDVILRLRQEGYSIRGIVTEINGRGMRARSGGPFYYALVNDIIRRVR